MVKVGRYASLGTAEGAVTGRASHALYAPDPVLDDFWAIELLAPDAQAALRNRESYERGHAPGASNFAPILAVGIGVLRYAEDEVAHQVASGVGQYVVLGAGFDSFALRRADLVDRVRVFEVDHPDVQQLKRERIEAAGPTPASLPEFVPVDFEVMSAAEGLAKSSFDPTRKAIFSWMNTLPYLTVEAIAATLDDLSSLCAPGSRLVANYIPAVQPSPEQAERLEGMGAYAASVGESHRKPWDPDELEALLASKGFATLEHISEDDLIDRYFRNREDGFAPGIPTRVILAERLSNSSS